jgi:primosomal protein N' (replication factor Y)
MTKYQTDSLFAPEEADKQICNHIIRVAFESGADTDFDYLVPDEFWPIGVGQRVEVPFGRKDKLQVGFCVVTGIPVGESFLAGGRGRKLKSISNLIDKEPLLNPMLMELAGWISSYYVCPLGQVLAAMVPAGVKRGAGVKTERQIFLAQDADEAIGQLRGRKQKQIAAFLRERGALDSDSALQLQSLLEMVGCTEAPIKKLADKLIIKMVRKTTLKSLPVIPEGMSAKSAKVVLNEDQQGALAHIMALLIAARPSFI